MSDETTSLVPYNPDSGGSDIATSSPPVQEPSTGYNHFGSSGFETPTISPENLPPAAIEDPIGRGVKAVDYTATRSPRDAVRDVLAEQREPGYLPTQQSQAVAPFNPANFYNQPGANHSDFVYQLRESIGAERTADLLFHVINEHRDEVLEYLGDAWRQAVAPHIEESELSSIPQDLRETAMRVKPELWEQMKWMGAQERNTMLAALKEGSEARERLDAEERYQRENVLQIYQAKQMEGLQSVLSDSEKKIRASLDSWRPYDDPAQDATARYNLFAMIKGHIAGLASEVISEAQADLQMAGIHNLSGRADMANAHVAGALNRIDSLTDRIIRLSAPFRQYFETLYRNDAAYRQLMAEAKRRVEAERNLGQTPVGDRQPGKFHIPSERLQQITEYAKAVSNG